MSDLSSQIIEALIDGFDLYENNATLMEVTDLLGDLETAQYNLGFLEGHEEGFNNGVESVEEF